MIDSKKRICCCGKSCVQGEETAIVLNGYRHEPYGVTGAFCGPEWRHEIRDLRARRADLIALLREVEWRGWTGTVDDPTTAAACPMCRGRTHNGVDGHAPDCRLAAALRREPK